MATMTIGYAPELTKDRARAIFARGLAPAYEIEDTPAFRRDFVVKKSPWAGVGVKLQQRKNRTTFVFTPMMPSLFMHTIFGGPASSLFLRSAWKQLEEDVARFIATADELRPTYPPVEPPAQLPARRAA